MTLTNSRTRTVAGLSAVLGLSLALGGCSDLITHSIENRETGILAFEQHDYPRATGAFRSALRQDPRDYLSHYYLGLSSLEMRNYQQALVAFRSCLETQNLTISGADDNATRVKALDGLAQAIVKSDASDIEVNKVEEAARAARGTAAGREYFVLAKVYRYRMLPDMALDYYNRAALADPKNFKYAKEYGLYCDQLQQAPKAREVLRQAYGANSRDKDVNDALVRLGVVLGPSLKDKADLVEPPLPKGPIPEVDMKKIKAAFGGDEGGGGSVKQVTPVGPTRTATTPRD